MIDKKPVPSASLAGDASTSCAPDAADRAALLEFTPVPRLRARSDGWTPDRQREFIAALADTGCISRAAKAVNMAAEGAYALRRHPQAQDFRRAWDTALNWGVQRLRDIAFERAIDGVPVPLFNNQGEQIGERRAYDNRLLMFTLRHHDPDQYGGTARNKISPATLEKLKAEWEKERKAAEEEERLRELDGKKGRLFQKLDQMRERMLANERRNEKPGDAERKKALAEFRELEASHNVLSMLGELYIKVAEDDRRWKEDCEAYARRRGKTWTPHPR